MNRIFAIAATLICLSAGKVLAQDDSTRYIFGLPVSEDDTARQFPVRDLAPKNTRTPVNASALPQSLLEILDREPQYEGWRDSTVYFDKNTGLYLVPVRYEQDVRIFGLNENGRPVTYDDVSR